MKKNCLIIVTLLSGLLLSSCNTPNTPKKDFENVEFSSASYVYDGRQHILDAVKGVDDKTTITYKGREYHSDVGEYSASATLSKKGYNDLTLYATLTITNADFSGISFTDKTYDYNGQEHSITAAGMPSFASVTYQNNVAINVGVYEAVAIISADNYNTLELHATLTINTASITGISFYSASYVYNGTEREIKVTGNIPSGVTVEYTNNKRTNVGSQTATAVLSGYGYATKTLTTTLTINPATFTGITFDSLTITYDGKPHSITPTGVPSFASVAYENNGQTAVGVYYVKAIISADNYNTLELTAILRIKTRSISGVALSDLTVEYDGNEHELVVSGTIPEGVTVEYTDNVRKDVGEQKVTATLSGEGYETLVLVAYLTVTAREITGITFEDGSFYYDGEEHGIYISGTLPTGVTVEYTDNTRTSIGSTYAKAVLSGEGYDSKVLWALITIIDPDAKDDEIECSYKKNRFFEESGTTNNNGTGKLITNRGDSVEFAYSGFGDGGSENWHTIEVGGYFYNTVPVNCFNDMVLSFAEGYEEFRIYYSYDGVFTTAQSKDCRTGFSGFISDSVLYDYHPLYFKIENIDDEPIILEKITIYFDLDLANPYVTLSSSDTNQGSVSGGGYRKPGDKITVSATAKSGYVFDAWYSNGSIVSFKSDYSFKMPDHDIELIASFVTTKQHQWDLDHGVRPVVDEVNKKATYGLYPQTHVKSQIYINALNNLESPEANGWYLLEGEYYAKVVATPHEFANGYIPEFDDGIQIIEGETYWFKCEPIEWRITHHNFNGTIYLLSEKLLNFMPFYKNRSAREIDGVTIYANNYEYSDIRVWLNGEFFNSAFCLDNNSVATTTVYNDKSTTAKGTSSYCCNTTYDKVFLPSYNEVATYSYGFSSDDDRRSFTTDYNRAIGATFMNSDEDDYIFFTSTYWTRSPDDTLYGNLPYIVSSVSSTGYMWHDWVTETANCVRPAISLNIF